MIVAELNTVEKRNVLVGIRFDSYTKELLDWALVKVANPGDRVVALHVCRNSDSISKDKPLLDGYLDDYEGLCSEKQVDLVGKVLKGSSIRKGLVREAKNCAAVAVIVGISRHNALGVSFRCWASIAKYCAKKLPPTAEVLAIHNGKVVFRRCYNSQLPGFNGDPKPSFYFVQSPTFKDSQYEFDDSETSEVVRPSHEVIQSFEDESIDRHVDSKDGEFRHVEKLNKPSLNSISQFMGDLGQQRPGWPLLRAASSLTPPAMETRKLSVVQWVMTLPRRSPPESPQSKPGSSAKTTFRTWNMESSNFVDKSKEHSLSKLGELPENLDLLLKTNSSGCTWFSHDVLKNWTSQFSPGDFSSKF
ncbi:unnamed protein product [Ilex paraguariensis]|uniref:UspA domain-containing protein n=1 Tax=Ilex paraguariensis TaxID=185542 RepID=A0ABC8RJM6_9AQUA